MKHHNGVRARGIVPDVLGYDKPIGRMHVGAVLGHQVNDGDVVLEAHQIGTGAKQPFPCEAGLEAFLRVHGRDGPAGGQ